MWNDRAVRFFLFVIAGAAAFVLMTGAGLPDLVASHFDAGGAVNGYMPRYAYLPAMVFLVCALPGMVALLTWRQLDKPGARINLPHGDYWLAPERRATIIAQIRAVVLQFSAMLVVFLCFMHWQVVRANRAPMPHLDDAWFFGGLAAFLVAAICWTVVFLRRFRRRP